MPVEIISEFSNRVDIGHLNKIASKQLHAVMKVYQIDNPRHAVNILIESLYKTMEKQQ